MLFGIDFSGRLFKRLYDLRIHLNVHLLSSVRINWCRIKGVKIGKYVKFSGSPVIRREPESIIQIGNYCVFNSSKYSVPIVLAKPNVFYTMKKNAEIFIDDYSGASGSTFVAAKSIRVGKNVMIGSNCTITDNDFHDINPANRKLNSKENVNANPVIIEDNVFLGFNCLILKGVTIGENAVIGANSIVMKSIPPNSIAIGNPCKVIFKRNWKQST